MTMMSRLAPYFLTVILFLTAALGVYFGKILIEVMGLDNGVWLKVFSGALFAMGMVWLGLALQMSMWSDNRLYYFTSILVAFIGVFKIVVAVTLFYHLLFY